MHAAYMCIHAPTLRYAHTYRAGRGNHRALIKQTVLPAIKCCPNLWSNASSSEYVRYPSHVVSSPSLTLTFISYHRVSTRQMTQTACSLMTDFIPQWEPLLLLVVLTQSALPTGFVASKKDSLGVVILFFIAYLRTGIIFGLSDASSSLFCLFL